MSNNLSVESLSTPEKLALMERLWESLSQRPSDVPSPAWHGAVLAERIAAVREGRASFVDWEDAKKRLQPWPRVELRHQSGIDTERERTYTF
jgi:putative addiction module component (TIGR02574 family)